MISLARLYEGPLVPLPPKLRTCDLALGTWHLVFGVNTDIIVRGNRLIKSSELFELFIYRVLVLLPRVIVRLVTDLKYHVKVPGSCFGASTYLSFISKEIKQKKKFNRTYKKLIILT